MHGHGHKVLRAFRYHHHAGGVVLGVERALRHQQAVHILAQLRLAGTHVQHVPHIADHRQAQKQLAARTGEGKHLRIHHGVGELLQHQLVGGPFDGIPVGVAHQHEHGVVVLLDQPVQVGAAARGGGGFGALAIDHGAHLRRRVLLVFRGGQSILEAVGVEADDAFLRGHRLIDPAVDAALLIGFVVVETAKSHIAGILAAEIALPLVDGGFQDGFLIAQIAPGALHQAPDLKSPLDHLGFQPDHLLVEVGFALEKRLLIILDGVAAVLQGSHFLGAVAGGIDVADHVAAIDHAALLSHIVDILHALLVIGGLIADDQRVARVGGAERAGFHHGGALRLGTHHVLKEVPRSSCNDHKGRKHLPELPAALAGRLFFALSVLARHFLHGLLHGGHGRRLLHAGLILHLLELLGGKHLLELLRRIHLLELLQRIHGLGLLIAISRIRIRLALRPGRCTLPALPLHTGRRLLRRHAVGLLPVYGAGRSLRIRILRLIGVRLQTRQPPFTVSSFAMPGPRWP